MPKPPSSTRNLKSTALTVVINSPCKLRSKSTGTKHNVDARAVQSDEEPEPQVGASNHIPAHAGAGQEGEMACNTDHHAADDRAAEDGEMRSEDGQGYGIGDVDSLAPTVNKKNKKTVNGIQQMTVHFDLLWLSRLRTMLNIEELEMTKTNRRASPVLESPQLTTVRYMFPYNVPPH